MAIRRGNPSVSASGDESTKFKEFKEKGTPRVFPDMAFVACKDSLGSLRQRLIEFGLSPWRMVVLSAHDDPGLRSLDNLFAALPGTIRIVAIDDLEHLLVPDDRTPKAMARLLLEVKSRCDARGIQPNVTHDPGSLNLGAL